MGAPPIQNPPRAALHEGFLRHARFRWARIAAWGCLAALVAYVAADIRPNPYGGSWYGYTTGTIGAGLIVWLALLGIRKRAMTPGNWSLKAWTSAHVYLGLALLVIATLHTGFRFGWNVHTLAYALMVLVILSGAFGVVAYAMLPALLSENRQEMTQAQMIEALRAIDRQLDEAAQPLPRAAVDLVLAALGEELFATSLRQRLSGLSAHCATDHALATLGQAAPGAPPEALARVETLLTRRAALLARLRRHLRIKGLLEVWLFVHVPTTIALIAALFAHIISVFYYW